MLIFTRLNYKLNHFKNSQKHFKASIFIVLLNFMDGFSIVMIFAIILFARLGIRLVTKYLEMKREDKED